jgi:hypothetical protein
MYKIPETLQHTKNLPGGIQILTFEHFRILSFHGQPEGQSADYMAEVQNAFESSQPDFSVCCFPLQMSGIYSDLRIFGSWEGETRLQAIGRNVYICSADNTLDMTALYDMTQIYYNMA